jgi:hypothetical protein
MNTLNRFTRLQAPLALVGGVLGGAGALGGSIGALGGAALGSALGGALGGSNKIKAPPPRSYLGEMQDALNSQGKIQDQLLGLERQYTPQYQDLQRTTLMGQMGTLQSLYGEAIPQSMALQSQYAQAQAPIYGQVGQLAQNAYQQTLDPQTRMLAAQMQQSAMEDMSYGRELTPQQQQLSQQSARQAMAARGLSGNQAIAQEVLNSYQMGSQREDRARAYAQNIYQGGIQQAGQAMALYGSPLLANMNTVSPTGLLVQGQAMQQGLGAKLFQPESQYNAGVYGANQSNATQVQMANAQIAAGQQSGMMSMLGQLGGAYLGNAGLFNSAPAGTGGYSPSFNSGYGSSLSTSQMAGGFNNSLGGGGSNLNFGSGAMYKF